MAGPEPHPVVLAEQRPEKGHPHDMVVVGVGQKNIEIQGLIIGQGARQAVQPCDDDGITLFDGAQELLKRDFPALLFECETRHRNGMPLQFIFEGLRELGYTQARALLPKGGFLKLSEFKESEHQVWGTRPYINMFLFEK